MKLLERGSHSVASCERVFLLTAAAQSENARGILRVPPGAAGYLNQARRGAQHRRDARGVAAAASRHVGEGRAGGHVVPGEVDARVRRGALQVPGAAFGRG